MSAALQGFISYADGKLHAVDYVELGFVHGHCRHRENVISARPVAVFGVQSCHPICTVCVAMVEAKVRRRADGMQREP